MKLFLQLGKFLYIHEILSPKLPYIKNLYHKPKNFLLN
ncbi:hypothetical protein BG20_I2229 [Candidatus Nitrosarchaeum limnium BG20]|uniref:Uncharacterized protein n=1 Tax=Candidatus Nitrosarchaeum limnium BG20 TaxID=859192 RepID=S2E4T1_9ARCH|nr:hypothetical protein BG20_I2229 [Candidatus Nitrosarchaeum limnium BG20]